MYISNGSSIFLRVISQQTFQLCGVKMISRPFLLDQVWDSVAALHHHTRLMLLEIPTVARTRGSSFSKKSRDGSWVKRVSCGFFFSLTSSSSESSSVLEQASSLTGFVGYGYPGNGGSGSELWVSICIHIPSHIPSGSHLELPHDRWSTLAFRLIKCGSAGGFDPV